MLIYLAARYGRREELCTIRTHLETLGHQITSRWLSGTHEIASRENGEDQEGTLNDSRRFAEEEMADLHAAECLIALTEPPRSSYSRGGRHTELGLALAWQKRIVVVGYRENVFCCLPQILFYKNTDTMLTAFELQRKETPHE